MYVVCYTYINEVPTAYAARAMCVNVHEQIRTIFQTSIEVKHCALCTDPLCWCVCVCVCVCAHMLNMYGPTQAPSRSACRTHVSSVFHYFICIYADHAWTHAGSVSLCV